MVDVIEGIIVKQLKKIADERGTIMHMLRADDPQFKQFGEVYFKKAIPGAINGWHVHKEMTINYSVPIGMIKLVAFDMREKSPTKGMLNEFFIGEDNYVLVSIPPGVANGFKAYGTKDALLVNCATHQHTEGEMIRIDPFSKEIGYDWEIKHK